MKKFGVKTLLLFLLAFPLQIFAQDVAGVWNGTIYNDSTQKFYTYQMVISDDNGKLSGYSYTVYDIDGKPEVGMRDLKIKRKENVFTITDDDLVYHNYSEAPPKGIHKVSILTVEVMDTTMTLKGEWHSNRTKKFSPLSGKIELHKASNYKNFEIFKKLEDLKVDDKLSFTPKAPKETSNEAAIAAKKKQEKEAEEKRVKEEKLMAEAKKKADKEAEEKRIKEEKAIAAAEKKAEKEAKEAEEKRIKEEKQITAAAEKKAKQEAKEAEEKKRKEEKLIAAAEEAKAKSAAIITTPPPPAKDVEKRKIIKTQEVFFKSDSLVLSLFDNGEVDGDIVTVLMNGQIIMPQVSLTTKAVRKTIYIDKSTPDSLQLVMFAENLGSLPPNTGLLVVNDGNDIYEVRFSADLQTNSAILLRRKKN
ncbi:hypothetical protein ACQ33O_03625 [Ferruginibacter sp. SUN002]|uniref:hypothetical protein n=1 Tax=Ferruginibacter sp. SUN002 TaxID=2937789 RepID=UPI003D36821F